MENPDYYFRYFYYKIRNKVNKNIFDIKKYIIPHKTQILSLEYVFIEFAAPNKKLKYTLPIATTLFIPYILKIAFMVSSFRNSGALLTNSPHVSQDIIKFLNFQIFKSNIIIRLILKNIIMYCQGPAALILLITL